MNYLQIEYRHSVRHGAALRHFRRSIVKAAKWAN